MTEAINLGGRYTEAINLDAKYAAERQAMTKAEHLDGIYAALSLKLADLITIDQPRRISFTSCFFI